MDIFDDDTMNSVTADKWQQHNPGPLDLHGPL